VLKGDEEISTITTREKTALHKHQRKIRNDLHKKKTSLPLSKKERNDLAEGNGVRSANGEEGKRKLRKPARNI